MATDDPKTQAISVAEAKTLLADLVKHVSRGESCVLGEESGVPVAAIVSVDDLNWLRQLEQRREPFFSRIDRVQEASKDVPPEEIEQEIDRIIARNRAADRAARKELAVTR